jgi:ABC-type transport system involved in multi-copper enzyme maturation permease subunit
VIATFARFDTLNFTSPLRKVLPPLLVVLVASLVLPWPAAGIASAAVVMTLLAPNHFAGDERGRLDTLYSTLPITRRTVVLGRYTSLITLYLAVAALATLVAVAITALRGDDIAVDVLIAVNLGSFAFFCLALAVQLPFFFALGYTRARPLVYLPVVVVAGGSWLVGQTGLLDGVDLTVAPSNPPLLGAAVLVIALALLTLSAAVSSARYARRDL